MDSTATKTVAQTARRSPPDAVRYRFFGLVNRKERWFISWKGWLLLLLLALGMSTWFVYGVYHFLAITHRVNADNLVVEGWVHTYAIFAGAEEFRTGSYQRVFTTGGPVGGNGGYVNDYQTSASVGAAALKNVGVPVSVIQMDPSHEMGRDRTYSSAIALRVWLRAHNIPVESMNVLTENTHARRTQLLFQRAFGQDVKVGIIAVPNLDYDAKHWWRYSEGVKDVISEGVAYLYVKFFFHPSKSLATENRETVSEAQNSRP
jgi:uncharacterized SAM-binding protein YcdF (DUF218 family)